MYLLQNMIETILFKSLSSCLKYQNYHLYLQNADTSVVSSGREHTDTSAFFVF